MKLVEEYAIALATLYGVVHYDKVIEIYNLHHDEKITTLGDLNLVELGNIGISFYDDYFVHIDIAEYDNLKKYSETQDRKPFYIPEKEELLNYSDPNYFEMNRYYKAIERYLVKNYHLKGAVLDEIMSNIYSNIQNNGDISSHFSDTKIHTVINYTDEEISKITDLYMDCAKNTRLWNYNGYTTTEIMNLISNTRVVKTKIGRNDPCHCGSGKKYKKCCLNNDEKANILTSTNNNEVEPIKHFRSQFSEFLLLSNTVIDVVKKVDESIIGNITSSFASVYLTYIRFKDTLKKEATSVFIFMLFDAVEDCFNDFKDEKLEYDQAFEKVFNKIIDNKKQYSYNKSLLYKNKDWNYKSVLNNEELKAMYCTNFASDYLEN